MASSTSPRFACHQACQASSCCILVAVAAASQLALSSEFFVDSARQKLLPGVQAFSRTQTAEGVDVPLDVPSFTWAAWVRPHHEAESTCDKAIPLKFEPSLRFLKFAF